MRTPNGRNTKGSEHRGTAHKVYIGPTVPTTRNIAALKYCHRIDRSVRSEVFRSDWNSFFLFLITSGRKQAKNVILNALIVLHAN